MTYRDEPDHFPTDWIDAGYFATEVEIEAILGPGYDAMPRLTDAAIASGQTTMLPG